MANTDSKQPSGQHEDLPSVISFQAGTEWSSQMHLDLNGHLIEHPSATFFLRVRGNSPEHGAIRDNDILIVDRALTPHPDSMIVAVIDGALVITPYRALDEHRKPKEPHGRPDRPLANADRAVWGVITYAIHKI